jgi:anthranilate synthase component 1
VSRGIRPGRARFRKLAQEFRMVPVVRELLGDCDTPVSAYRKLARERPSFLLESVEGGETWGRYSILGAAANGRFTARGDSVRLEWNGRIRESKEADPIGALRRWMKRRRAARLAGLPRFLGGAVGYVSYDAIRYVEAIPDRHRVDTELPEIDLLLVDEVVVFDNLSHSMFLVVCTDAARDPDAAYDQARGRIARLEERLREALPATAQTRRQGKPTPLASGVRRRDFEASVRRAQEYIRAGDCFQVVLSHEMRARLSASSLDVYRALRSINPSPYMFHVDYGTRQLLGASPEVLVRVEDRHALLRPIAGTRRRGRTPAEDRRRVDDLLADAKERAEHVMLVDLGRNDLGRVCEYASVRAENLMHVEKYSHVIHLVSDLNGRLRDGVDCFDALRACFPAGTVSGAPKIRAMEIIDELETRRRGVYAGAVGYFGFDGSMDSCIAIRTALCEAGEIRVGVGAGIVLDSTPAREWEETQEKAGALAAALERAERGLE